MNDLQLSIPGIEREAINPLKLRFDRKFFSSIPQAPGVYWMFDEHSRLLYIGKAKNLRARLRSYRSTRPARLPSKTLRLVKKVYSIQWDLAESESHALLKENELLRALKPPFNVSNTRPETYLYLAYQIGETEIELRLLFKTPAQVSSAQASFAMTQSLDEKAVVIHGAFKGLPAVLKGHAALIRWLWSFVFENCTYPSQLLRNVAPKTYRLTLPAFACTYQQSYAARLAEAHVHLELYLRGERMLPEIPLPEEEPIPFVQRMWLRDHVLLQNLFYGSICRHRALLAEFGLNGRAIAQTCIDDLIVMRRFRPQYQT